MPAESFPFGIKLSLEPFSLATIERFVAYEMPQPGILGPKEQASPRRRTRRRRPRLTRPSATVSWPRTALHRVHHDRRTLPQDRGRLPGDSACTAIDMIIEQGEAPTAAHPDAHFLLFDRIRCEYEAAMAEADIAGKVFDPVRKVVSNPTTRNDAGSVGGTPITDPTTRRVADLFNVSYETMLLMLFRLLAHTHESETELERLAGGTLLLMTSVLRPLGEALTKMPAGPEHHGLSAGPAFHSTREIQLLPHMRAAWVIFGERLLHIARTGTGLFVSQPGMPRQVEELRPPCRSRASASRREIGDGTPRPKRPSSGRPQPMHRRRWSRWPTDPIWRATSAR